MSGEGDRASRPNSLVLEAPPPEREPLHFDVQLIGAPPEVEQLVNNIKQVAEEFLYHWKTFPIVLPPSRFTGPGNRLSDIIIPPPCDEIDAAALDAGVEPEPLSPKQLHSIRERGLHKDKIYKPKELNAKQLESIREWGEFEVPSRHFPGQSHVWRVAGWLHRGRARAREQFYEHVASALALLAVTARDRLLDDCPVSVLAGFAAFKDGLHRMVDLLIGLPSMEARDLEKKIREERSRYLVAELICKPEHAAHIACVAAWVSRAVRRADRDARAPPPLPLLYTTPHRALVDLRLYRRETLRRAAPTLQAILEREARGWFLHFRERHAALLRTQKMPPKDIEEEVRAAAMKEYVSRVCAAVLNSGPLAALGQDVPALLADQLRAAAILDRAEEKVRQKIEAGLASSEARLRASHPILSRSNAWRTRKLAASATRLRAELRWAAAEDATANLGACSLHQHKYFLARDVAFRRDREPLLAAELKAATVPTRVFTWRARVWRVANWRVLRGRESVPRSEQVFHLHADDVAVSDTRWPGWRLLNIGHRIRCWSWNALYILCVVVVWNGPVSIRALLSREPLIPEYELSQVDGTLVPKRESSVPTLCSRLQSLWRYVSKERSRIDSEPDTGLVGSGALRAARRAALVGGVGGLGSLALVVAQPALTALVCALALLAAATLALWLPPVVLLVHLSNVLLYDLDCPTDALNRWFPLLEAVVWRVGVLGLVQPVAALLLALVICPLASLLLFLGGGVWWCVRGAWESVTWRVLVRAARVPAHDSAYCRRVAGPGLAAPAALRVTAGQAAAVATARAEADILSEWADNTEKYLETPLRDYQHFVDACFGPFSVQIAKTGAYRALEREISSLASSVRAATAARRRELSPPLTSAARARCRLARADLRRAAGTVAAEMRRLYADRDKEWWNARGLEVDDWHALAADVLVDVFHPDILLPLDGAALQLESGPGSRQWEQRCARAAPPDIVGGAEAGWGGAPRVPPPALDLAAFNPRAAALPPLPPPAVVALVLYNRDSDNPVPLESELCAEILRALEDAPDADDKRDSVERYRGGGSSEGSSSDGDGDGDGDGDMVSIDEQRRSVCGKESPPVSVRGACRWTLTGRGVRLRADLASPEDVTLDAERRGTSV